MKKQPIIVLLTSGILVYEGYWRVLILQVVAKEFLTHWETLLDTGMYLLILAGLIQYIVTRWRHSLLLRAGVFYAVFAPLFQFLIILFFLGLTRRGANGQNDQIAGIMLKTHLRRLPVTIVLYYILIVLNRSRMAVGAAREAAAGETSTGEATAEEAATGEAAAVEAAAEEAAVDESPRPVSKGTRLLIRMIDVAFVLLIFRLGNGLIQWFWRPYLPDSYPGLLWALKWALGGALFVYYLLMEGITGTTLGKIVTNTIIVDDRGRRAGVGSLLGRTFARLIPFDGLSFLLRKRGWHDALSDTYVTRGDLP